MIYMCIKFQENISNSFQVTQIYHRNHYFQSSKVITPNVGKPELLFLCFAPRLMMPYICMKSHQNIWNDFQLTDRTRVHSRNGYFQNLLCSKGRNSKSRSTRITNFVVLRCFCLFVLRFYGPVNSMESCRAQSVYLTTRLLGRLSPLSG